MARQISILEVGPSSIGKGGEFIQSDSMIAELRSELSQIDSALADLEAGTK